MPYIIGLLGVLAAAGIWIYRINAAARGAQELADIAGEAANLPRKMRFRHKARQKGLDIVTDPREAATVLMVCVARLPGDISLEQKTIIRTQIRDHFDFSEAAAEELLSRAIWITSDLALPENAVPKMMALITPAVDPSERAALLAMLQAVAEAEGEARPEQIAFIARCRDRSALN